MRIIRVIVALTVLLSINFAQLAQASDTINPDTKTQSEQKTIENIFSTPIAYANEGVVQNVENNETQKTQEEIENEKILSNWKEKQADKWEKLTGEKFVINASAYTAAADECGKNDGITSSGIKAKAGRTIACPPSYPFGTKVNIEGYGTFVCEDRGGAIKVNKIDIYMNTKAEAFAFGRKNLVAQVIL